MDNEELKKQIAAYCKAVPGIVACYLFGSFATGSNRMGSDLDLAFLLTSEIPPAEFGAFKDEVVVGLGRLTRLVIHPIIMNNAGELVLGQIFRKGVCVYEADEAALRVFRRNKFPLVAEFSYYSEMMLSAQKQRYGAEADG
jgi:predicted nucleotidyltransferase